jgi:hypothetical protein
MCLPVMPSKQASYSSNGMIGLSRIQVIVDHFNSHILTLYDQKDILNNMKIGFKVERNDNIVEFFV